MGTISNTTLSNQGLKPCKKSGIECVIQPRIHDSQQKSLPKYPALGYLADGITSSIYTQGMKKLVTLVLFLLLLSSFAAAQGNGGGNGNGNNANGQWGNANWPQFVITWLQNGGQVPLPLAVMVIHEARAWGMQNFGLNQGQMLQKYFQGQLTVEFVSTSPPSLTFRVRYGGGDIIVVTDDF